MPLVTTTLGNYDDLLSSTLQIYAPRVEDNFYDALPHWHMLNKSEAIDTYDGGESFVIPVLFGDNTTAKRMTSAYDTISVSPQNNMTVAQYLPQQYTVSITISRKDELANSGAARAINLLQQKTESAELAQRNLLNGDALADTSSTAGAILGLEEMFENLAVGSQVNVIGGIARTGNNFWHHQFGDVSSSFSTNGRSVMSTVYNSCSAGSSDHPQMVLTTQSAYENYERTLDPIVRLTPLGDRAGAVGDPKFQMLNFRGALVYFDEAVVADSMYMLNPRYYRLKVHMEDHFAVLPFVKFPNQTARVAQISWTGQICVSNFKRLGKIANVDDF